MRVSVIITSGSTALNAHVRINCLWKCVNAMHKNPGHSFELILVDNSSTESHRRAIQEIAETYKTVTHVVQNRLNEFAGGGYRQGVKLADGDIIVTAADDVLPAEYWLSVLIAPIVEFPMRKYIGALQKGSSVKARRRGTINVAQTGGTDLPIEYYEMSRAGAYLWAAPRQAYDKTHHWGRAHFADTRLCQAWMSDGWLFTIPATGDWLRHTNLNYLRPWDYTKEKRQNAYLNKWEYLDEVWGSGTVSTREAWVPKVDYPLKNPVRIGPGSYSEEFLAKAEELKRLDV